MLWSLWQHGKHVLVKVPMDTAAVVANFYKSKV